MKKATLLLIFLTLLATGVPVWADGGFYWHEEVPPHIPYQRAILWYDGQQETLLLQSKYDLPNGATPDSLGWLVPVPSVPELASLESGQADSLFASIEAVASPKITRVSDILLISFFLIVPPGAILILVTCFLSLFVPSLHYVWQHRSALAIGAFLILLPIPTLALSSQGIILIFLGPACAVLALLLCLLSRFVPGLRILEKNRLILATSALLSLATFVAVFVATVTSLSLDSSPSVEEGIELIKAEQVGIYDIQVIKANQAGNLIEWLNDNGFHFDEEDQQVFNDYLRRDWSFVVAQVDPGRSTNETEIVSAGLVAPLILRFEADAPIYPLALTSITGHKTQILLYLFSRDKWTSNGRLELHYAARFETQPGRHIVPSGFFTGRELSLPYLSKFKRTLNPEQMQDDLVFTRAEDDRTYRKRIFVW